MHFWQVLEDLLPTADLRSDFGTAIPYLQVITVGFPGARQTLRRHGEKRTVSNHYNQYWARQKRYDVAHSPVIST